MQVTFLFIEEAPTITIEMDHVPRIGELVNLDAIKELDFENEQGYLDFKDEEIHIRHWRVVDVAWTPAAGGKSTAIVFLEEDVKKTS